MRVSNSVSKMVSPRRHCSPRRSLRYGSNLRKPLRIKEPVTLPKTPTSYHQCSTVTKSTSPWRTQPSFPYNLRLSPNWTSAVLPPSLPRLLVPHGVDKATIPKTMEEMDKFLSSVWEDEVPVSSEYSRKVSTKLIYCQNLTF